MRRILVASIAVLFFAGAPKAEDANPPKELSDLLDTMVQVYLASYACDPFVHGQPATFLPHIDRFQRNFTERRYFLQDRSQLEKARDAISSISEEMAMAFCAKELDRLLDDYEWQSFKFQKTPLGKRIMAPVLLKRTWQ